MYAAFLQLSRMCSHAIVQWCACVCTPRCLLHSAVSTLYSNLASLSPFAIIWFACQIDPNRQCVSEMADPITILGGAAATTQLSVYAYKLLVATAALPRHLRQAPDRIQTWLNQASTMMMLLDNAQSVMGVPDQGTASLFDQCRKNNARIFEILHPHKRLRRASNHTRLLDLVFHVRRRSDVEQLMLSFENSFQMLAMNLML
jgi:hypothetical protein